MDDSALSGFIEVFVREGQSGLDLIFVASFNGLSDSLDIGFERGAYGLVDSGFDCCSFDVFFR